MSCKDYDFPIKGFIDTSFIDWKGQLSSVIFTGGCNFRCPYCHNSSIVLHPDRLEDVPLEYVVCHLRKYKNWVESVVITGGEPTINMNLFSIIGQLKIEGIKIKLDTNGSSPSIIKGLVNDGLIDYIAMDIKGPVDRYKRWCGVNVDRKKIEESVQFILEGNVDYEFRMTVVPFLHREDDIYEVADYIGDAKKFFIQEFKPNNTLNPAFSDIKPFSPEKMQKIRQHVSNQLNIASQDLQIKKG
ncbi:MAG: anaerobic ribonucleoside-triphosphate reductase activating protein [Proteobacteria bacterium]|nr:anaerobic ribonucleoside-triphosphate reductase activating protein [Pseudomonadota bacterium]